MKISDAVNPNCPLPAMTSGGSLQNPNGSSAGFGAAAQVGQAGPMSQPMPMMGPQGRINQAGPMHPQVSPATVHELVSTVPAPQGIQAGFGNSEELHLGVMQGQMQSPVKPFVWGK